MASTWLSGIKVKFYDNGKFACYLNCKFYLYVDNI